LVGLLVLVVGGVLGLGVGHTIEDIGAASAGVAAAAAANGRQDIEIGILKANAEMRGRQLDRIEGKVDELVKAAKR
jgi:hypothetical protein